MQKHQSIVSSIEIVVVIRWRKFKILGANYNAINCLPVVIQEHVRVMPVQVFGSKGMLVSENQRPTELTSHLKTGTSQDRIKFSFPQRYADSYVLAMKHFLNVVQGRAI